MTQRSDVSLKEAAKAGFSSLIVQAGLVFAALLLILLVTGGQPAAGTVALSVGLGILGVAWAEAKRLSYSEPQNNYSQELKAAELIRLYRKGRRDFSGENLRGQNFRGQNLSSVYFSQVNLHGADLCGAILYGAILYGANLHGANLRAADLSAADLSRADLSGADLRGTQVLGTNFESAIFTGACLEDWNINSATNFDGAICDYFYFKADQRERRPIEGTFKPGEFAALFQQALDTLDLIFKDGIDWQAFFQSLQDLRNQYTDQDLAIQAIEKKQGDAFVVRVEVPPAAHKTVIESRIKELYESQIKALEAVYKRLVRFREQQLEDARQIIQIQRQEKSTLIEVIQTMASTQPGPKSELRSAQFAGGIANTVQVSQSGSTINNYGPNTEDITRLLTALRDQVQSFPPDQKDEANDVLDDLERDLKEEQPDQGRIGRRLKKLVALGATIGTIASGAAAVSSDIATFTTNVFELTEKLGVPIEQVQFNQILPEDSP